MGFLPQTSKPIRLQAAFCGGEAEGQVFGSCDGFERCDREWDMERPRDKASNLLNPQNQFIPCHLQRLISCWLPSYEPLVFLVEEWSTQRDMDSEKSTRAEASSASPGSLNLVDLVA